jgi:hypothetical protein
VSEKRPKPYTKVSRGTVAEKSSAVDVVLLVDAESFGVLLDRLVHAAALERLVSADLERIELLDPPQECAAEANEDQKRIG